MTIYEYISNKSYINVNGKKVEDKEDVKMVLNKGIMNIDINDNGNKKHYNVRLNKKILSDLESVPYNLEDRLKRDFMREKQEQLNFSPYPFKKMEIIILPKNNFKKTSNNNKKIKKSKKRKVKKNKSKKTKKV
jgi:hypothetical protein